VTNQSCVATRKVEVTVL